MPVVEGSRATSRIGVERSLSIEDEHNLVTAIRLMATDVGCAIWPGTPGNYVCVHPQSAEHCVEHRVNKQALICDMLSQ